MQKPFLILALLVISVAAFPQARIDTIQHKLDVATQKIGTYPLQKSLIHLPDTLNKPRHKIDSVVNALNNPSEAVDGKLASIKNSIQKKIDSLESKGQPTGHLKKTLDSINTISNLPQEQLSKLSSLQQQLTDSLRSKIPGLDSLKAIRDKASSAMNEVNRVSTEIGIGPLGEDLKPDIQSKIPGGSDLPGFNTPNIKTDFGKIGDPSTKIPNVNAELPQTNLPAMKKELPNLNTNVKDIIPDDVKKVQDGLGNITKTVSQATSVVKEGEEYLKEVKTIQEEGLARSEKIPELAEKQLLRVDEIQQFQKETSAVTAQMEEYKALIEQYKQEKAIKEDLEKRSKELANELVLKNQPKIDDSMKKIGKLKKKFSTVADMRDLPKRTPNPMKELHWRERLRPGFALYTFSTDRTWLQVDPEILYKLTGNISIGAGAIYRMSINPGNISFHDFKNSYGLKGFAQYHAYKGFWLRAEGQQVYWKPWHLKTQDPKYIDKVNVVAAGICKTYNISKRIKGNTQVLYHFSWNGSDPYKQKILLRIGFDFSIKKKESKPWETKLKELRKAHRSQ